MSKRIIIFAPHPDDEIIGCFWVLKYFRNDIEKIVYLDTPDLTDTRKEELKNFLRETGIFGEVLSLRRIIRMTRDIENKIVFLPHISDKHPHHEKLYFLHHLLEGANIVVFYSVYMNADFIEVLPRKLQEEKKVWLDKYYPSQKELWLYDAKYYLFEGYMTRGIHTLFTAIL